MLRYVKNLVMAHELGLENPQVVSVPTIEDMFTIELGENAQILSGNLQNILNPDNTDIVSIKITEYDQLLFRINFREPLNPYSVILSGSNSGNNMPHVVAWRRKDNPTYISGLKNLTMDGTEIWSSTYKNYDDYYSLEFNSYHRYSSGGKTYYQSKINTFELKYVKISYTPQ